ncbi:MAG: ATP-binding cassette protein [Solirubrobacterales bacterium]|nr:ATP-binding cassette protein [Solirubrobacterales bacterium]
MRLLDAAQRVRAVEALRRVLDADVHLETDAAALSVAVEAPDHAAEALVALAQAGIPVAQFALGQPSLDEVFLALTGNVTEPADEEVAA